MIPLKALIPAARAARGRDSENKSTPKDPAPSAQHTVTSGDRNPRRESRSPQPTSENSSEARASCKIGTASLSPQHIVAIRDVNVLYAVWLEKLSLFCK